MGLASFGRRGGHNDSHDSDSGGLPSFGRRGGDYGHGNDVHRQSLSGGSENWENQSKAAEKAGLTWLEWAKRTLNKAAKEEVGP
jgi:hypothetical protein